MRKSRILARPRARRPPTENPPCRRPSKPRPPRRSIAGRAAPASGAATASSPTLPSGQPALMENWGLTRCPSSLLDRLSARRAGPRRFLDEQDQDERVLRGLVPGSAEDERLVECDGDRGPVQRDGDDPALIVLLQAGEGDRG